MRKRSRAPAGGTELSCPSAAVSSREKSAADLLPCSWMHPVTRSAVWLRQASRQPSALRALSSNSDPAPHTLTEPPTPSPSPAASTSSAPSKLDAARWQAERAQLIALLHKTRQEAHARWTAWLSTAQATAKERYAQLELDRKLKEAGARINEATGYEEIDRLRQRVGLHGQSSAGLPNRALPAPELVCTLGGLLMHRLNLQRRTCWR